MNLEEITDQIPDVEVRESVAAAMVDILRPLTEMARDPNMCSPDERLRLVVDALKLIKILIETLNETQAKGEEEYRATRALAWECFNAIPDHIKAKRNLRPRLQALRIPDPV